MGCKVSKRSKKDDVVLLCRKRKEQLKLAVDRRYAFAYAQCKYNQSLYAMAVAIRSFVASHSSPPASDSERTKNTGAGPFLDSETSISSSEVDREKLPQSSDEENRDYNAGTAGEELGLVLLNDEALREGRELLEALKEVEVQFHRAYNSSLDVSKMLGTNMDQMQAALAETEENSSKLKKSRSIPSILTSSSSRKNLLRSSTRSSSTSTHFNGGLFDDNGAMGSKCHSLTLGMLYAGEQKLYEEVKAGEETRRLFDRNCSHSKNQGHGLKTDNKIGEKLHSEILVAKRSAESIFKEIQKQRDEELQPQLIELLQGLMKNWKIMSETHETQHKIMSEVKWLKCSSYGKSHQHETQTLEVAIQNWRACFAQYVSSQKTYIEALDGWMIKFDAPETEAYSENWSSLRPCRVSAPPTTEICHNWLDGIDKLPYKSVAGAMESFGKDVQALMVQQGKEHQQKRKVDGLAEKLRRQASLLEMDKSVLEIKLFCEQEDKPHEQKQMKPLEKKENDLDISKNKLEVAKAEHHTAMKETHDMYVKGFQKGFSSVFKTLAEFSKTSMKIYDELLE